MRGSHGVCDCDILRRANVKADLYLLRGGGGGGSSEPSEPPLGTGMRYNEQQTSTPDIKCLCTPPVLAFPGIHTRHLHQ